MAPSQPIIGRPPVPEISTGVYMITSVSTGLKVSRRIVEDKSAAPKAICVLPRHQEQYASPWNVTKNSDGTFTMENRGASAQESENGALLARINPGTPPLFARWKLIKFPNGAPGSQEWAYLIESADGDEHHRWTVPGDVGREPRDPRPLACSPETVQGFPAAQLFTFKKVQV
ncbi:hypothetical protein ABW21_db0209272 [Orbilia brochopaga]|nr:hypothetical protein ABW21_db0209272 [Drechslerella brochopaga]